MKYVFHEGGPTKGFTILWGILGIKKFENPWSGLVYFTITQYILLRQKQLLGYTEYRQKQYKLCSTSHITIATTTLVHHRSM